MASNPVPNAGELSEAQTQSNIQTATAQQRLNMVNQNTPWGNISYSENGTNADGTPRFQANTTLSPQLMQLFNQGMGTQQQIGNAAGRMAGNLDFSSLNLPQYQQYGSGPNLNTRGGQGGNIQSRIANSGRIQANLGTNDFSADRQRVEDTLMGELNQQSDRDLGSLEQRLASRGITQGSEAYTNAMRDFNGGRSANRTSAILGAGQEQNRQQQLALNAGNFANSAQNQLFGQNLAQGQFGNESQAQRFNQSFANAGFGNQAQQQMYQNQNTTTGLNNQIQDSQFGNAQTRNNQMINQLMALRNGSQVGQPQFSQTPQSGVNGTDVAGNAWNQYNAQQGQNNQFWSGLGSIGGTIGGWMFSSKKLKDDVHKIGETPGGNDVVSYRYKGSPMLRTGYIAERVQKKQPEAVRKGPGGFLQVAYSKVR